MATTPRLRNLTWRLEAAGFDLISALIRCLPVDVASALGGRLFRLIGPLTKAHRTADANLRLAFPQLDECEHRRLLAAQWDNFGRYIFEFPLYDRLTPASGRVEVIGGDALARVVTSGRPAVLISGHFSNFEIMAAVILAAGVDCDVTYRAANNPFVDERIKRGRRAYGVRLFAPKGEEGARDLLAALSAGRSIALLNDQKYDAGVEGEFFGHKVNTLPAAVRLALRFGIDILPMSIQRTSGARFRCVIHDPIKVLRTGDKASDIKVGVASINAFIEAQVRARPGEWWWMHRRWPTKA